MNTSRMNLLIGDIHSDREVHMETVVDNLIDSVFKEVNDRGRFEVSSTSQGDPYLMQVPKKSNVDRRLEYWKNMLAQRRALQARLRRATGRSPKDMLLNRPLKVENRLEIIGVGQNIDGDLPERKTRDFTNYDTVCGFVPSFNDLETVEQWGVNMGEVYVSAPDTSSTLPSSEVVIGGNQLLVKPKVAIQEPCIKCEAGKSDTGPCIRINGVYYRPMVPEFPPTVERTFTCNPFQRHLRMIIRFENSGGVTLRCCWRQANFFCNNETLLDPEPSDFLFDTHPFMLRSGESRDVNVLYQPRCVNIVKQRWLLFTQPRIFFRRPFSFCLNIHGRCTPPKEYLDRVAQVKNPARMWAEQCGVGDCEVRPTEEKFTLCPYIRELDEREAFNIRNRRYNCSTLDDLERLQAFFERVNPYYTSWDFSAFSLIDLVCTNPDKQTRIKLFDELLDLFSVLRSPPLHRYTQSDSPRRIQNCAHSDLIYVRGLLASCLDVWEEKVVGLEQRLAKAEKKETKSKNFRDSMHMLLQAMIGNAAEDIVSVIESDAAV
ncbi:hypothetical protein KR018_010363 [Drosophila ironensis]|nr:hypothetical protein KR018_010363 [Drosophila ironensis]